MMNFLCVVLFFSDQPEAFRSEKRPERNYSLRQIPQALAQPGRHGSTNAAVPAEPRRLSRAYPEGHA